MVTDPLDALCENFLYGSQGGPEGPLAPPTRPAQLRSRFAPAQLASDAGRLARKAKTGAAENREVVQAAALLSRNRPLGVDLPCAGQSSDRPPGPPRHDQDGCCRAGRRAALHIGFFDSHTITFNHPAKTFTISSV